MGEKNVPNRRYTEEFRVEAARLANSVGHNEAARRLGVLVATIGNWARKQQRADASMSTPVTASRVKPGVSELEADVSRLSKELASAKLDVEILSKSDGILCEGVAVKYAWIDANRHQYDVIRLSRVLRVSRSGYCQWRVREPSKSAQRRAELDAKISALHARSRATYARRRLVKDLAAARRQNER